MADEHRIGIDLGFIGDVPAKATAIDLHRIVPPMFWCFRMREARNSHSVSKYAR
jgi:hypothetical protein